MKILKTQVKYVESFGTDAYSESTHYTIELVDGSILKGRMGGTPSDEQIIIRMKKDFIHTAVDSCCAIKELLEITGEIEIAFDTEEGEEILKVSELSFWDLEDYTIQTMVESEIFRRYTPEIEELYCKIKPLRDDESVEDFFVDPEIFYEKEISLLEYKKTLGDD